MTATEIAVTRTREPITIMVPLLWLAARNDNSSIVDSGVPPTPVIDGVPLCALDMHTRIGRTAIQRFARENVDVSGGSLPNPAVVESNTLYMLMSLTRL